jgi:2-oxoglutaroyl-CoA hydrolase
MALQHPDAALLEKPDGFSIHLDLAHERADIVLGRPPFNVILMPQRDQLRAAFEALDAHPGVRVIVLRAEGWDAKEAMEALSALVEVGFHEQD